MKNKLGLIFILFLTLSCNRNTSENGKDYIGEITGVSFSENKNYLIVNFEGCQTCLSYAETFLNDFAFEKMVSEKGELVVVFTGYPSKKWLKIKMPKMLNSENIYFDEIGKYKSYSLNLSYPLVYATSTKEFIEVSIDKISIYETLKVLLNE